ncbi:MAG: hypothetical protein UY23_C0001G0071 [Candidatus Jorgensenbacteria bacterium GW2011_GWA1_48_11]|uniref:Bacterial sugar transferase domain-containing protein n=1 Tax=Candidatus Jorgensenbacteria bacterium GW2011_GWA1_48_11 TaxID=1618660 RepID=A0A0G1XAU8_9BACT|nr:MAG: hypothetical protein UY23_C0001G0071 [Candidatus Jorgensenbacteria bacterium GW2011_GWA1_48_11]KKW11958.1 MAG: hypothetical protein UY51_C0005G0200 [Candidatus Jorgensenbacteria bacterium GW2011_GWB1_49_9]
MSLAKKTGLLIGDILILYVSLALTLLIRYGFFELSDRFKTHFWPFSLIFAIWLLIFYLAELYHHQTMRNAAVLFKALAIAVFLAGVVSVIVFYLFGQFFELTPKTNLLLFAFIFLVLNYLWRAAIIKFLKRNILGITVIGDSPLMTETIKYLKENPQTGYETTEWLKEPENIDLKTVIKTIRENESQLVVIQPHFTKNFANLNIAYKLLPLGVGIVNFWDFYETIFEKAPLEELEEGWFVENVATRRPYYDALKRLLDLVLSFTIGIILLPLTMILAIIIKASSSGPLLYRQERIGKGGKLFTIYKFRTMHNDNRGPLWTEENDNRITAVGKLLRFAHLDEIPQLWNILKGDISFTGPRPERKELAEQYQKFPYYEIRHIVKPGLTGWAQINYKASASLEEAYEKLRYDIFYVKNRSFFLDLKIILKTIKYVFFSH